MELSKMTMVSLHKHVLSTQWGLQAPTLLQDGAIIVSVHKPPEVKGPGFHQGGISSSLGFWILGVGLL